MSAFLLLLKNEKEVGRMSLIEDAKSGIVLDGAMSDELEKQGVETDNKLWTATALVDQLNKVYNAHQDYFRAGAELVITDTYQANVQAFEESGYSKKKLKNLLEMLLMLLKRHEMIIKKKLVNTIM